MQGEISTYALPSPVWWAELPFNEMEQAQHPFERSRSGISSKGTNEKPLSNPTAALLDLSLLHRGPHSANVLWLRRQVTPKQTLPLTPFLQTLTT